MSSDNNARPQVLCVDDERSILNALKRAMRHESFDLICTDSPNHALKLLAEHEFSVVISDYRMPEMSGVEFLFLVHEVYPRTKRMLLTGQADMDGVIAAINNGGIHKFFVKPWDNLGLSMAIRECIGMYELEHENQHLTKQLEAANTMLHSLNGDLTSHLASVVQQLDQSEYYDADTCLPNDKLLIKHVDEYLERHLDGSRKLVLIAIGISDYALLDTGLESESRKSMVNDMCNQLKHAIREIDLLARVRDDTFCVATWTDGDDDSICDMTNRLIISADSTTRYNDGGSFVKTCAGISIFPEHGSNATDLLDNAIVAMRQARDRPSLGMLFYDQSTRAISSSKLALIDDLHRALKNNEFFLEFQPRVNSSTGKVVAAEALLRWRHPIQKSIPPAEFVPLLEETGLINPVGEWIIREVCSLAQELQERDVTMLVAVNVSPYQFQDGNLHQYVARVCSETGIPPNKFLELEITENALISDMEQTLSTMRKLNDLGVKLAIDDFGTGYSSFSYLATLPVDYLKIDQSFVAELEHNKSSKAIINAIISVAKSLELKVIAEGVETAEQAAILTALGCNEIQGYFYSKPVGLETLLSIAVSGLPLQSDMPAIKAS